MAEEKKCKKCGMPLVKTEKCCSCEEGVCYHCCSCPAGCACGCQKKE